MHFVCVECYAQKQHISDSNYLDDFAVFVLFLFRTALLYAQYFLCAIRICNKFDFFMLRIK